MKILLLPLFILFFWNNTANAQFCLPGAIHFQTQAQIDAFSTQYPGCTQILGNVLIQESVPGDITNLLGLSGLTAINGGLKISENAALTTLQGLIGITAVGKNLIFRDNAALNNLNGLDALGSVGGHLFIQNNPSLVSLEAILGLMSINGQLRIVNNDALTNLCGLDNINPASITYLKIVNCELLAECCMNSICAYVNNPAYPATISNNAPDCNSREELIADCNAGVPCSPENIFLHSQAEVDAFPTDHPGCSLITGSVHISGFDITDLSPLAQIIHIGELLTIKYGTGLTNLHGLDNLQWVGQSVIIKENEFLTSLDGLGSLTHIGGTLEIQLNPVLSDLIALNSLTSVKSINILTNSALSDLNGLQGITSLQGSLNISSNAGLVTLYGLNSLTSINGSFIMQVNPSLASLTGLESLQTMNSFLALSVNHSLTSLSPLANLTHLGGYLVIQSHNNLTDLHGLEGLHYLGGTLRIPNNNGIVSLDGLENLTFISGDIRIYDNTALTDLTALHGVNSISGYIEIDNNDALTTLAGLENILAGTVTDLIIQGNEQLSICEVESICDYLEIPANSSTIAANAPGCNSRPEVEAACTGTLPCPINLTLNTQADVDAFPILYPGCAIIDGDLTIDGSSIVDLSPLIQLTEVKGNLDIGSYLGGTSLTDLTGLNNLIKVGKSFNIDDNDNLLSLNGLQSLTEQGASPNYGGDLGIYHNDKLTDISALGNLISTGYLAVRFNKDLESLNGLQSVATVDGGLDISHNDKLVDLNGLNSITALEYYLVIQSNPSLVSLTGLEGLQSVGTFVLIEVNPSLTNLSGLEGLSSLGWFLQIYGNNTLTDISALSGIQSINGDLTIEKNPVLPNLTGLDMIDPAGISNLIIKDNAVLSVCHLSNICEYLSNPANPATIFGNAAGCASSQEVEANCPSLQLSPNPAQGRLLLDVSDFLGQAVWIRIVDLRGTPVWQYRHEAQPLTTIDLDLRAIGIREGGNYFVTCQTDTGTYSKTLLILTE